MSLEVIIPAYMPDEKLEKIIQKLNLQEIKPDKIRVLLTTDYIDEIKALQNKLGNSVKVEQIMKDDFCHGGTRQYAMDTSVADYVMYMTQDAIPADNYLTSNLLKALKKTEAAVAYARQIPYKDADDIEKFSRRFNYPKNGFTNSKETLKEKGIRAIFCSDSCAVYKRAVHNILGGFDRTTDFNEDSIFAYYALINDYEVVYCAEAKVYHSHNLTLKQQFKRNKNIALCQKQHNEVYGSISSEKEGIKYLMTGTAYFLKKKQFKNILLLFENCIVRYAGFFAGKHNI